jgi:hypothetical protein
LKEEAVVEIAKLHERRRRESAFIAGGERP